MLGCQYKEISNFQLNLLSKRKIKQNTLTCLDKLHNSKGLRIARTLLNNAYDKLLTKMKRIPVIVPWTTVPFLISIETVSLFNFIKNFSIRKFSKRKRINFKIIKRITLKKKIQFPRTNEKKKSESEIIIPHELHGCSDHGVATEQLGA